MMKMWYRISFFNTTPDTKVFERLVMLILETLNPKSLHPKL